MTPDNVVITGANSGIGFEVAKHFARQGSNVVMACRNLDKAETAQREIITRIPEARTVVLPLDVSDLASVKKFSQLVSEQVGSLDVLINNAGIAAVPLTRNDAGHELQLATNYLGTFALTGLLLPLFAPDKPGRIVNVGSLAHRLGKLNLDDLNWENTPYNEWKGYANSKIAVMSYTLELNQRLHNSGRPIIALGAHPGFANTNIQQNSPTLQRRQNANGWLQQKIQAIIPLPEQAAKPVILAASSEGVTGGDYYGPGGMLETGIFGKPGKAKINSVAKDRKVANRLWTISETMTGISYLPG